VSAPITKPPKGSPFTKLGTGSRVLDRYLSGLWGIQADHALEALREPRERDAFEYGERCGVQAGLLRAEQLLAEVLKTENDERK
jgi:hypothetical protein